MDDFGRILLLFREWVGGINDLFLLNLYFGNLEYLVDFSLFGVIVEKERWSLNEVDVWNDVIFDRIKW